MRIYFEATIDELIEVHERLLSRSKVARSWLRQGATMTALLSGLMIAIPVFIFAFAVADRTPLAALVIACALALPSAAIAWHVHRDTVRHRFRTYFQEQFGDRDTIPFELELSETGIWTKQLGVQNTFEWAIVEEINQTEDAIEFYTYGGGAVFVRKRAFASAEEQQQFIDATKQYLNASRTSSNWLRDS